MAIGFRIRIPFLMWLSGILLMAQPGLARISASIDFLRFPSEKGGGRLVLLLGVEGKSLVHLPVSKGGFKGAASFAISINDSVSNYFADRLDLATPLLSDSGQFDQHYSASKVVPLPPGRFTVQMVVFDPNSSDTTRERLSFNVEIPDASKSNGLSDLLFIEPGFFNPSKPVFDQGTSAFRISDFYSKRDTIIRFYAEAFGFSSTFPSGTPVVSRMRVIDLNSGKSLDDFGKIKRIRISSNMAYLTELGIRQLPSGSYSLVWDLIDTSGKVMARTSRNFTRSNPEAGGVVVQAGKSMDRLMGEISKIPLEEARHLVASLLPIAGSAEQTSIDYLRKKGAEDQVKNYLHDFWSRRSDSDPLKSLQEYRGLLAFADKKYSTQTMKAYQTERGRVVLQYGKPNIIENEYSDRNRKAMQNLNTIPYEIWYYYNLESPIKQTDVMFVFVQQNRGNDNYRLLHSSAIGEVRNVEWRSVVENNATYNFDRLNPDDRQEISNPRIAR